MSLGDNPDPSSPSARYIYASMVTPASTFDVTLATGERNLRKRQPVPGYDPSRYATERLWAKSRDGKRIPITIAYRKSLFRRDGSAPLYIEGYGSFGFANDPRFQQQPRIAVGSWVRCCDCACSGRGRASPGLVRRREAHQQEEHVQRLRRCDRFSLVQERYGARNKVFASGGSAGGLLMGVIANEAGDRYGIPDLRCHLSMRSPPCLTKRSL